MNRLRLIVVRGKSDGYMRLESNQFIRRPISLSPLLQQLFASPVLIAVGASVGLVGPKPSSLLWFNLLAIREVSSHDQRDLLLSHLLDGDLEGIRLTLEIDQHWRIHAKFPLARVFASQHPPRG